MQNPKVWIVDCEGNRQKVVLKDQQFKFSGKQKTGIYTIYAKSDNGKISEGKITIRKNWDWYLRSAAKNVLKYPPRATTHCETWYGFYTGYSCLKHFPDDDFMKKLNERFDLIFPILYDTNDLKAIKIPHRIQNTSSMIGVMVDKYQALGDIQVLKNASKLADWLIEYSQGKDGAFRNGHTHYTSVIYPAKSIMELMEVEKEQKGDYWKEAYLRHYKSVKAAMDELALNKDNIDTEGQLTFEDGMISCSALQLGQFALLQENNSLREKYKNVALYLIEKHRCLTQMKIPDSRMRNGSMRFWESQYDVYIMPNMINSPHGWSSWNTYALYYAYLLTGEIDYLKQVMNGLGSAMQMIDINGYLRWSFFTNPYEEVIQMNQPLQNSNPDGYDGGHHHPLQHPYEKYILGEQYVDMISDWIRGNSQDNDVHEHFKCLEEIALTNAFVYENENGEISGYNCKIKHKWNRIVIIPVSDLCEKIHINVNSE